MSFAKLWNEISHKQLKPVLDSPDVMAHSIRPFNDIFGGKTRIVIPLGNTEENKFQKDLEQLPNPLGHILKSDLKTGIITIPIKTEQGIKQRQQRIGAYLQDLIKKAERDDRFDLSRIYKEKLNWWEKNKANIGKANPNSSSGISIIISRSPIDIVRMSDHREWQSCHSVKGSYFHCAVQEAKTGGAIAYVVRNQELKQVPDLQAKDIFADDDRDIDGIHPLERLRLRRFDSEDEKISVLVPERRTYGTKHVGFKQAVDTWAKSVQEFAEPPNFDDFNLRGGSYQDNDADDIWNDFFGTEVSGTKKSTDRDEEGQNAGDNLDEQARNLIAGHHYDHWGVNAEVSGDDNEPYLFINAGTTYSFNEELFEKIPDDDDTKTWNDDNNLGKEIKNAFKDKFGVGGYFCEQIHLDHQDGAVRFHIYFDPEGNDLDDLEHCLDEVDDLDNKYDQQFREIYLILKDRSFIKEQEFHANFKHFRHDEEDGELTSEPMYIGWWEQNSSIEPHRIDGYFNQHKHDALALFPNGLSPGDVQFSVDYKLKGLIRVYLTIRTMMPKGGVATTQKTWMTALQNIDQHWDYFYKRATQWFQSMKQLFDNAWKTIGRSKDGSLAIAQYHINQARINPPQIKLPNIQKYHPDQKHINFKDWFEMNGY